MTLAALLCRNAVGDDAVLSPIVVAAARQMSDGTRRDGRPGIKKVEKEVGPYPVRRDKGTLLMGVHQNQIVLLLIHPAMRQRNLATYRSRVGGGGHLNRVIEKLVEGAHHTRATMLPKRSCVRQSGPALR